MLSSNGHDTISTTTRARARAAAALGRRSPPQVSPAPTWAPVVSVPRASEAPSPSPTLAAPSPVDVFTRRPSAAPTLPSLQFGGCCVNESICFSQVTSTLCNSFVGSRFSPNASCACTSQQSGGAGCCQLTTGFAGCSDTLPADNSCHLLVGGTRLFNHECRFDGHCTLIPSPSPTRYPTPVPTRRSVVPPASTPAPTAPGIPFACCAFTFFPQPGLCFDAHFPSECIVAERGPAYSRCSDTYGVCTTELLGACCNGTECVGELTFDTCSTLQQTRLSPTPYTWLGNGTTCPLPPSTNCSFASGGTGSAAGVCCCRAAANATVAETCIDNVVGVSRERCHAACLNRHGTYFSGGFVAATADCTVCSQQPEACCYDLACADVPRAECISRYGGRPATNQSLLCSQIDIRHQCGYSDEPTREPTVAPSPEPTPSPPCGLCANQAIGCLVYAGITRRQSSPYPDGCYYNTTACSTSVPNTGDGEACSCDCGCIDTGTWAPCGTCGLCYEEPMRPCFNTIDGQALDGYCMVNGARCTDGQIGLGDGRPCTCDCGCMIDGQGLPRWSSCSVAPATPSPTTPSPTAVCGACPLGGDVGCGHQLGRGGGRGGGAAPNPAHVSHY